MDFTANSGIWGTMFGVPCVVADNFLKLATGDQLKVLIYCLRCSGKSCSAEEISLNTGVSVSAVADCILFWQQANVLAQNSISTIENSIMKQQPITEQNIDSADNTSENKTPVRQRQKQNFNPSEISCMLHDSTDISELFKVAETALGPLNHTQQNSLIWMFDYLGLKKEVIITLLFYCVKIEKTNSSYIEKIACNWAENDINTLSAAEDEVQRLTVTRDYTGQIMKAFEMNRRPTTKQSEFITQWKEIGFSIELIHYAYEKTIEQINKLSFDYINKILLKWRENGYTTVKNVRDAENSYKKSKQTSVRSSESTSSDVDKYKVVINKF